MTGCKARKERKYTCILSRLLSRKMCCFAPFNLFTMTTGTAFLQSCIKRFKDYKALGEKTFDQLDDEQLHTLLNGESNSIAVIVKHLHGNMLSRWTNFLTEDGEKDWRKRDEEFESSTRAKEEVTALWNEGWILFLTTLESLTEDDLAKTITIRSQPLTVIDALCRQLAHYSYHVGQIVYIGRWLKKEHWQSLSIPKGASTRFNRQMQQQYK